MSIGAKVKELRRELGGISQAELARRLGITPNAVAAWEQGVREPDEINCLRLSQLHEGPLSEFFVARARIKGGFRSQPVSLESLQAAMIDGFAKIEQTLTLILEEVKSSTASRSVRRHRSASRRK